jgi:hypothetical protein
MAGGGCCGSPHYPERVGGVDVYAAVLEHGVRTPEEFSAHLRDRGLPGDPGVPNAS